MSFLVGDAGRDVVGIRLPRWGRVAKVPDVVVPFVLLGPDGVPVAVVEAYLRDFVACDNRAGSVRSYAYDLLRWWRWLQVVGCAWDKATSAEVREFVLWMKHATKPHQVPRTASLATVGTVNPITRKQYLDDRYAPRTVRHSNAVLRSFYEFWIDRGQGPLVNPVPRRHGRGRPNAHHNPLEPFRVEGKLRYNPSVPKRRPRALSDDAWDALFAAMRSDRDRALVAVCVSNAARASELLGVRGVDLDWGEQLVRVYRKGSDAEQWLPVSDDAFVWLRLYLDQIGELAPNEVIWRLRRRSRASQGGWERRSMNYEAWRAVFRRVNTALGTNYSMHDLRHTCALRMLHDDSLSLRDVQVILGHAHLSTTQLYLEDDPHEVIARVRQHLSARGQVAIQPVIQAAGYDTDDLAVLFGHGGAR